MTRMKLVAAFAALAIIAAACSADSEPAPTTGPSSTTSPTTAPEDPPSTSHPAPDLPFVTGDLVALELPRAPADVIDADIAAVVSADTAFGLDLFGVIAADDNLMLSPYSIATALSMLYPGARGDTATEIADAMHLAVDDATLHAVRNAIDVALSAEPPPPSDTDTREPFAIRPANSAWGQGGYPFLDDYLEILATNYGAGLRLADFIGAPDASRVAINDWVEEATEDRIEDLIPDGVITIDTRLVLVNAIWFKANWAQKFDPALTADGDFTLLDGSPVQVPLMHSNGRGQYASTSLFEAVRLPYAGDAAMVVALPNQGTPADLAAALTPEAMDIEWGGFQLDLTLPSFEFESDVKLKAALQALGIETAFLPGRADLTGIADPSDLFVSDALHKSFIALDEDGTEAAAATALIVSATSLPPPATFTADRPFLFWIEHSSTGEILFLGQVTNPLVG